MPIGAIEKEANLCGANPKEWAHSYYEKKDWMEYEAATASLPSAQTDMVPVGNKEGGTTTHMPTTVLDEMKPYPGVDYLGMGYDVVYGNPSGDTDFMLDPGFREPVRVMKYGGGWITRDG